MSAFIPIQKRTWANVDIDAVKHNFRLIRTQVGQSKKVCCVIKANAYGHGAVKLAKIYEAEGADYFAVSNIEEALQLRKNDISLPIVILGYTNPECAGILVDNKISQCVYSKTFGEELNRYAETQNVKVNIHIKIDSGMGRIGFACKTGNTDDLTDALEICQLPNLNSEGIFTHFAVADEGSNGEKYTRMQFENFSRAVQYLEERGVKFEVRHCANSAAIFDYPEMHLDMVRAGVILYGLQPSREIKNPASLRPALTLETIISHVKNLKAGECISYGRTFTADRDMIVATIPVGYADGLWRSNGKHGMCVEICDKFAPIVGRICMDQCMIDVSDIPAAKPGSPVLVYGKREEISVDAIAKANDTINYEIVCAIGQRVPRVYWSNGKIIEVQDNLI